MTRLFFLWNGLKSENANLIHTLKEREKRKWLKTIPLDPGLDSSNTTDNPPTTRRSRRYNKFGRLLRKRQHFRQKRRVPNPINVDQLHQLDPVNLSSVSMDAYQINLLRKGPSFCPTPKDINWQSVNAFGVWMLSVSEREFVVVVSCFEFVLCHTNVSICVSGCCCYCGFVDYVTLKTRTIERAKVFVSAIAFCFTANPIAFGEDFLIVALDNNLAGS